MRNECDEVDITAMLMETREVVESEDLDFGRISGRIGSMAEKMGKYSITMPRSLAEAAREVSGDAGLSAYIAGAVEARVRHDKLGQFLAEYEESHEPITQEEIDEVDREMARAEADRAERARRSGKSKKADAA
jgi:hypothetical protein